jgi:hypothetical protein
MLRLPYYDGSNEPRIMLFGLTHAPFEAIQPLFNNLGEGEGLIEVQSQPFVQSIGGPRLLAPCFSVNSTQSGTS